MAILKNNWFLEPIIEFEYKSYQVLGYTQLLTSYFAANKFYPYLDGLSKHITLLKTYQNARHDLEEKLAREIEFLDFKNKRIIRKPVADTNGLIASLQEIVEFGETHFENCYEKAFTALEQARKEIDINLLGMSGSNTNKGILLFRKPKKTRVYSYNVRMVMRPGPFDVYKDIKTSYLTDVNTGPFTNFNTLKCDIIKNSSFDFGINAYLVETNTDMPYFEMVLPEVKKYIIELSR